MTSKGKPQSRAFSFRELTVWKTDLPDVKFGVLNCRNTRMLLFSFTMGDYSPEARIPCLLCVQIPGKPFGLSLPTATTGNQFIHHQRYTRIESTSGTGWGGFPPFMPLMERQFGRGRRTGHVT